MGEEARPGRSGVERLSYGMPFRTSGNLLFSSLLCDFILRKKAFYTAEDVHRLTIKAERFQNSGLGNSPVVFSKVWSGFLEFRGIYGLSFPPFSSSSPGVVEIRSRSSQEHVFFFFFLVPAFSSGPDVLESSEFRRSGLVILVFELTWNLEMVRDFWGRASERKRHGNRPLFGFPSQNCVLEGLVWNCSVGVLDFWDFCS